MLRERLLAIAGAQLPEVDVIKLLSDLISCGGGVTLELDELRLKLIRREGRFILKKEDQRRTSSSMPPRASRRPMDHDR
ncbi:MAG TPA: hypothetical protein VGI70_03600 [Polyangiales bacterium]|jgi:hypothetical protein